jgi:hypothetical protein
LIALYIVVYAIAIAIQSAILAVSLFLVEDVKASSFKEFGGGGTLGRCAAIVVVASIVGIIPWGIGLVLGLIVWFVGIMFLFQKPVGQTFILFLINAIISLGVGRLLGNLLTSLLAA